MATTFQVIHLGTFSRLDGSEWNRTVENADDLVGATFGDPGNPLFENIRTFSPEDFGWGADSAYDTQNQRFWDPSSWSGPRYDTFRIDGGSPQEVDATAIFDATITYADGTTANLTAVVMQDTTGGLYLMPEVADNADQAALEAKPIQSLEITGVADDGINLEASRQVADFAVCFAAGTAIRTPSGEVPIEELRIGDLVTTLDNGPQPVRWISRTPLAPAQLAARPQLCPILIPRGVLGVSRDLLVSPLHGMLLGRDHLTRAKHLAELPRSGIRVARSVRQVTYFHLMFDAHQILFAENAPSESFYPGPMAQRVLSPANLADLGARFPGLARPGLAREDVLAAYGPPARDFLSRKALLSARAAGGRKAGKEPARAGAAERIAG